LHISDNVTFKEIAVEMEISIIDKLIEKVDLWRDEDYTCDYPAISEILNFSIVESEREKTLEYLRKAQFEALETYWYLRLVEKTPHVFELYKKFYNDPIKLLKALGIPIENQEILKLALEGGVDYILEQVKNNDEFVKKFRLEAVRESLTLKYPSYILALAMGAGKTVLIGSIIATEFAMSLEYPDANFVKNALVFAPGKTILGALKEISDMPYEKILPDRLYKQFITTVKFTYTRDGEKDIPIIKGSSFNVIITNTEKIRIQKHTITQTLIKDFLENPSKIDEIKQEVANLRLQTIASLPNLAIFSDEAHHTYGQPLDKRLKRVRQTVDYLAENTNVFVVVNTTGTPYYKKQILKDVVYCYSLSQGIKDGILKEVRDNIVGYLDIADDEFITDVITDFFKNYKEVKIYDSSPAKLAIYFPQIEDLTNAKSIVEKTLMDRGLDPSIVLEVHNKSAEETKDLFDNRINDPHLPYRVFLLVNKGTEGWNCLSLFSTALARDLRSSNNFCLQAASRCLRQVPGNVHKAKIYLSQANVRILDAQLRETYGESLQELNRTPQDIIKEKLVLRKIEIPSILIKRKIRKVVPIDREIDINQIEFKKPDIPVEETKKIIYGLKEIPDKKGVLIAMEEEKMITEEDFIDSYSFAVELSSLYRLPLMPIYEKIKGLYPDGEIPERHAYKIREQLEGQIKNYKIIEEEIEQALALIKPEGFNKEEKNGKVIYTTEIIYYKSKAEKLLTSYEKFKDLNKKDFGFHYMPYNFDSEHEKDFFIKLLIELNENPDDIQDIYFTGGLTDPNKTDFFFEYRGKDRKWHNYYPDFLIKKNNGKMIIVEIKMERLRTDEIDGEDGSKAKSVREIQGLNSDKLKYEILFTDEDKIGFEDMQTIRDIIWR
jgi:Type III restriction enzyme, res subunit.